MKYNHFLLLSICISILYIFILFIFHQKYNLIERLGNYTGHYTSSSLFNVHPLLTKSDSSNSYSGPLEISFNPAGKKTYKVNDPCVSTRQDYVPATNTSKAYCTQGENPDKKIVDINGLKKDYRVRFLGYWKDKDGFLYNIIKDGVGDGMNIILKIISPDANITSLFKSAGSCSPAQESFKGTVALDDSTKLPKAIFEGLLPLYICVEGSSYAGDICSHSVIKENWDQKKSDLLVWGNNHTSDSSIKWYKTYDDNYATNCFTFIKNKTYVYNNNNNTSFEQTLNSVNEYNLNSECSIPCKDATDCNAFAFIPGSLGIAGKCIFYNVDKTKTTSFTLTKDMSLTEIADLKSISVQDLFSEEKNKTILTTHNIDAATSTNKIPKDGVVTIPKKINDSFGHLYEIKETLPKNCGGAGATGATGAGAGATGTVAIN